MRKKATSLIIFLSFTSFLFSQTDTSNVHIPWNWDKLSITGSYKNGRLMPTNVFVRGSNTNSVVLDDYQQFSLQLTSQSTGDHLWEQLCNYPRWGVAISANDFFDKAEIGIPIGVYGFISSPFFRINRFSLNYDLGFGLSFNWKSFNPTTNQYNVAIGAGQAFMSNAALQLEYALTNRIDIMGGLGFSHFSNGAIKLPNFGFNVVAPKVSVKYNFYERPKFIKHEIPKFNANNEWVFSAFAGMKNIIYDSLNVTLSEHYKGVFFPVYGISALFNRRISYASKIGMGMTLNYNESVNAQVAIDNREIEDIDGPLGDKIQLSIYPSYEICADKVSLVLQPAFYILRKASKNQSPVFHQRIMIKYHISDNVFAGITLRDFDIHADFVEWTVGYRISK
ncbi:MAG: acyloxyacyl hydrolase [Paludibacter sp.]|nr:acyloxyacyl hydrolase [Paludibacter sp.]